MSEPVDRWEWLDVVRRARLGRTTKAVAVMLATYANQDGTRVFPGLPRIAVVCEVGYNTAQRCLTELREFGLIERVYRAGAPGRADEYRLILADGLAERVPTPAQIDLEIRKVRRPWGGKPRHTPSGEVKPAESEPLPTARGEVEESDGDTSTHGASGDEPTSTHGTTGPLPAPCVATNHAHEPLTTTNHIAADVRTAVTVPSDSTPDQDPIFGEEGKPRLRLVQPPKRGLGFCVDCYAAGQFTVAADPENGSACAHHLAKEAS